MDPTLLSQPIFYESAYFAANPDARRRVTNREFGNAREHYDRVGQASGLVAHWVVPLEIDPEQYFLHHPMARDFVDRGSDPDVTCAASHFRRYGNRAGYTFFRRTIEPKVVYVGRKQRFVTTLDDNFVPGFIALLQSMKERAGIPFCFTVILYAPLSDRSRFMIRRLGVDITFVAREALGDFIVDPTKNRHERHLPSMWKPLMWLLPHDEPCFYLDSDVLCLNSLHGVYDLEPTTVVVNQFSFGRGPDWDTDYKASGTCPFNAGLMLYRPSEAIFKEMQAFANEAYDGETIPYGDQPIQNDFFATRRREMLHFADLTWNFSTFYVRLYPGIDWRSKAKFMHFAHDNKPWRDPPQEEWMEPLWKLWEGFYARGGGRREPEDTMGPNDRYGVG